MAMAMYVDGRMDLASYSVLVSGSCRMGRTPMNTLAWVAATVATIALSFDIFTNATEPSAFILGFASILVVCFCIVMTIDAAIDDITTTGGLDT